MVDKQIYKQNGLKENGSQNLWPLHLNWGCKNGSNIRGDIGVGCRYEIG
jgi:hypothetical protein